MRFIVFLLPLVLVGCGSVGGRYPDYRGGPGYGRGYPEIGSGEVGRGGGHVHGRNDRYEMAPPVLHIPPGHLPPPGMCRIWFPERPPGQQPPPGDCDYVSRRVPPGAWLVSVPARDRDHVHVSVFDSRRPGQVVDTGIYYRDRGRLIREDGGRR